MIEAVEVHETRITKTIPVELKHPVSTGVWLGIGFLLAPVMLFMIITFVIVIFMVIGHYFQ